MISLIINNVLCAAILLFVCAQHFHIIEVKKKTPKHGLWGLYYGIWATGVAYIIGWWYLPMFIFLRGWFYSPCLNLFRGKKWNYWSLTSTSIIDKVERFLFRKFWIARAVYFVGWIVTILFEAKVIIWKT